MLRCRSGEVAEIIQVDRDMRRKKRRKKKRMEMDGGIEEGGFDET